MYMYIHTCSIHTTQHIPKVVHRGCNFYWGGVVGGWGCHVIVQQALLWNVVNAMLRECHAPCISMTPSVDLVKG